MSKIRISPRFSLSNSCLHVFVSYLLLFYTWHCVKFSGLWPQNLHLDIIESKTGWTIILKIEYNSFKSYKNRQTVPYSPVDNLQFHSKNVQRLPKSIAIRNVTFGNCCKAWVMIFNLIPTNFIRIALRQQWQQYLPEI